jgi:hypothetical protein
MRNKMLAVIVLMVWLGVFSVMVSGCVANRTALQENKIIAVEAGSAWMQLSAEYDRLYALPDNAYEDKVYLAHNFAPILNKLQKAEIIYLDAVLAWSKSMPIDTIAAPALQPANVALAKTEVNRLIVDIQRIIVEFTQRKTTTGGK